MEKPGNIGKVNPFKVPENYFDTLSERMSSIAFSAEKQEKHVPVYRRLRPYLAVAASVLILFTIGYTALRISSHEKNPVLIPELSFQEYYEMVVNEIDLMTLEENLEHEIFSGGIPDVNSNEIIDYLLLENIDENEIYALL